MLWFGLHAFLAIVSGGEIINLGTTATVAMVVIAAAVGFFDTRRRREFGLLGNLGIPVAAPSTLWALTTLVLEIALRIVTSLALPST
jgi:hypothetical protein